MPLAELNKCLKVMQLPHWDIIKFWQGGNHLFSESDPNQPFNGVRKPCQQPYQYQLAALRFKERSDPEYDTVTIVDQLNRMKLGRRGMLSFDGSDFRKDKDYAAMRGKLVAK